MTEEELKEREREHQKDLECFLQALFVESCKTKMVLPQLLVFSLSFI